MNLLMNLIVAVQIISALVMIGLVLIQHGKGADMGASFGSGASGSLFGATGSANFLSRSTAVCPASSSSARWPWPTSATSAMPRARVAAACSSVPLQPVRRQSLLRPWSVRSPPRRWWLQPVRRESLLRLHRPRSSEYLPVEFKAVRRATPLAIRTLEAKPADVVKLVDTLS